MPILIWLLLRLTKAADLVGDGSSFLSRFSPVSIIDNVWLVGTPKADKNSVANNSLTAPFRVNLPSPPLLKLVWPDPLVPKSHKNLFLSKNCANKKPLPSPKSEL